MPMFLDTIKATAKSVAGIGVLNPTKERIDALACFLCAAQQYLSVMAGWAGALQGARSLCKPVRQPPAQFATR